MKISSVGYGDTRLPVDYEEDRFVLLGDSVKAGELSDADLGRSLDRPIGCERIEEIISPGESVLIVVPDATRNAAAGQVVNLLVRRLIANGTAPFEISAIFATGIHRPVTKAERDEILTPFITQRIKTLDHDPRDLMRIVSFGETESGIPAELDRAMVEFDRSVIVGSVTFHYFAGFTGGRKLICPGLASAKTIAATHRLAFDFEKKKRTVGVGPAVLDGNAVHEAFAAVVRFKEPSFSVNTIVNDDGTASAAFCGDWEEAHRRACGAYAGRHRIGIKEKRDLVLVSAGGLPYDINLIQAHKALDAASRACSDGGTILFVAECREGFGRADFKDWFLEGSSERIAAKLCDGYKVNGQTAWSLREKTERFDVRILSELPEDATQLMGMSTINAIEEINRVMRGSKSGYILADGAKCLPDLKDK